MTSKLTSIVIATSHINKIISFYEKLGLNFQKKTISLSGDIYTTYSGGLEIAFIEKNQIQVDLQPKYSLSFVVKDVDVVSCELSRDGFLPILDPTSFVEGRKAIFIDPDGRSVEILQS